MSASFISDQLVKEASDSALRVRRDKAALSSGGKSHPAKSLQPEATGAVMEVTKWLKPSGKRVTIR
jgi:hypothetical protein